jgi:serine protease Do
LTLLAVSLGGLACLVIAAAAVPSNTDRSESGPALANVRDLSEAFTTVTKAVTPAVVYIDVEKAIPVGNSQLPMQGLPPWLNDEQMRQFFGDRLPKFESPQQPRRSQGQGSGFIISTDGYILTNNHVVGDADRMKVTLADGRHFTAKLVGADARSDVAVIKVDATDLPTLPMGNSGDVEVGQMVLAVGSPFGLSGTVTSGIVSATGRTSVGITDYENFIQTDAAINPGNSGGPLVNLEGEAIGINTAIASSNGGYMGIGFAIPINMAHEICDQLIATGTVTRGYLGVAIQDLTPDLAKSFGIEGTEGVLISDVTSDSPAEKAGLRTGDVIVKFNSTDVTKMAPFRNLVARTSPESKVKIEVLRDGERKTLTLSLGTLPGNGAVSSVGVDEVETLGFAVKPLSDELAAQLGYAGDSGVIVSSVEPGSKVDAAGLESGMLIDEINRTPVRSIAEFNKAMKDGADKTILLRVKKGEYSRYIVLPQEN